jgi:hypothetical protein
MYLIECSVRGCTLKLEICDSGGGASSQTRLRRRCDENFDRSQYLVQQWHVFDCIRCLATLDVSVTKALTAARSFATRLRSRGCWPSH